MPAEYRENGEVTDTGMMLPLYSFSVTSPVTASCVLLTNALIALRSGVYHCPL